MMSVERNTTEEKCGCVLTTETSDEHFPYVTISSWAKIVEFEPCPTHAPHIEKTDTGWVWHREPQS